MNLAIIAIYKAILKLKIKLNSVKDLDKTLVYSNDHFYEFLLMPDQQIIIKNGMVEFKILERIGIGVYNPRCLKTLKL